MPTTNTFKWSVIGAGPAGIAAVGKLIDKGVAPKEIVWIDPEFKVGDFGSKWHSVSSNTSVKLFLRFLHASDSFNYANCPHDFQLNHLDEASTCKLHFMSEPLQWVTEQLKQQVVCKHGSAQKLRLNNRAWEINLGDDLVIAKNAILAIGSQPKTLNLPNLEVIPLEAAMDIKQLHSLCGPEDTVAVFGSSHSAIIAIRDLLERPVKKVINIYRAPLRYAVHLDDWILFDDTGLKGSTAEWARNNIDGRLPDNLIRIHDNPENIKHYLPQCNKVIYTIGFERRHLPTVEDFSHIDYNVHNGIIAPGLFGFGIAFPEAQHDRYGILEYRVGLWKFMDYLHRALPLWLRYST